MSGSTNQALVRTQQLPSREQLRWIVKLTEALHPGSLAYGYLQRRNTDTGEVVATTATIRVHDPLYLNFGLADEYFHIAWTTQLLRFETVGSQGLLRRAKADGSIVAGGSGTVSIWTSAGDSGVNVTAHYTWAPGETINEGDELWIKYAPKDRQWIILMDEDNDAECSVIHMPTEDPPGIHSHLYVDALEAPHVQTEWSEQGITGVIYIAHCDLAACLTVTIQKGLITDIVGPTISYSEPPTGDSGTVINDETFAKRSDCPMP
jgi:hypothetical protein